jgi:hypothetical protein
MKQLVSLIVFLVSTIGVFAQFTIEMDDYNKKQAEAIELQRVNDSLKRAQLEESIIRANDIRYRIKWVNWFTLRQTIGFIESTQNISYYGYIQTKNTWTIPVSLRLSSSKKYNSGALIEGYNPDSWKKYLVDLGMSGFRNLKDDFHLMMGVQLPIGWERYRYDAETTADKKHTNFLIGAGLEERLFYMTPNKAGLVMGIGFYQRVMSSKLYNFDAGMTFEVGYKF